MRHPAFVGGGRRGREGPIASSPAPPALEELASAKRKASLLFFFSGLSQEIGLGTQVGGLSQAHKREREVLPCPCRQRRLGGGCWGGSLPQGRTVCVPLLACFSACTENVGKIGS